MARKAKVERTTLETAVSLELNLDGSGRAALQSGVAFLDHMLTLWCRHGFFDLTLEAKGELAVVPHLLVEDILLCLGRAFLEALGDKARLNATALAPCPWTALVMAAVDCRAPFYYAMPLPPGPVGPRIRLFLEFWQAFVNEGRLNLSKWSGRNKHHLVELLLRQRRGH